MLYLVDMPRDKVSIENKLRFLTLKSDEQFEKKLKLLMDNYFEMEGMFLLFRMLIEAFLKWSMTDAAAFVQTAV